MNDFDTEADAAGSCRAVVFDLDGLLVNTERLYVEVGRRILARRGCDFPQELIDQMMGRPTPVAIELMIAYHGLDDTVEQIIGESDAIFPALLDAHLEPMPGADELLDYLSEHGIPYGLATGSRGRFVQMVLDRTGWHGRFEFILAAEDVREGKPAPEIYCTATQRLGLPPRQVLVLEDSRQGCAAAVAAGAYTVAVPGEHSRHHTFPGVRFTAWGLGDPRIRTVLTGFRNRPDGHSTE